MGDDWHSREIQEVMEALRTGPGGLSEEEADSRLREFGYNEIVGREGVSPLQIFLSQLKDVFVIILLIAMAISIFAGYYEAQAKPGPTTLIEDYADGIVIGAIVILNSVVGFVQEYRSEKAMEAMKRMTTPMARVIRSGVETSIPTRLIVPGDVVKLESGDRVPGDGRIIEAYALRTDEAVLTGESTPIEKTSKILSEDIPLHDKTNMTFMATHIVYGRGRALVTSTGMRSEFGRIAELVQSSSKEETPLKIKLTGFAKRLATIIIVICAIIFILRGINSNWQVEGLVEAFMISIALAVSAVPEGLPAIVTVTLALGASDLAKRNALIRRLSSAETLGSTTIICSDKTGTLTKGEMTVRKIYVDGQMIDVSGVGYEPVGGFTADGSPVNPKEHRALDLFLRTGALCNNASLEVEEGSWRIIGDPTEGALIVAAAKAKQKLIDLEKAHRRIGEIPFSSERKMMTTVHSHGGALTANVKGATEVVLSRCTHIVENGTAVELTDRKKRQIITVNDGLAEKAFRVLAVAYRELPESIEDFEEDLVERDLTFIGLVGLYDPPRQETVEANRLCRKAGIRTVMITGDHKKTAIAVAREVGMYQEGDIVLQGAELDRMSDQEYERIVEKVTVYARVSPEHKMRIVESLKGKGHIVAMTGDGVNDAPAIKRADIGIAMGITGTDVTREASDMVLADDNFATIVNAVEGGRIIYDNIRKFIRYLLSSNFDEILVVGSFALLGLPPILLPGMILWINLVTDGGPALALSKDPPFENVMERAPRNPREGVTHRLIGFILVYVALQSGTTIASFCLKYFFANSSVEEARTLAFIQACFFELIVVWNCRSEHHSVFKTGISGFLSNKFLLAAVAAGMLLTASLCYVPVFQIMFNTTPLGPADWLWVILMSSLGLLVIPERFIGRKILRWR